MHIGMADIIDLVADDDVTAAPTPAVVDLAYRGLEDAKRALFAALENELDGKADLLLKRTCFLLERGKEAGANEAERDARFRAAYPDEHAAFAAAEKRVREQRLNVELAALEVDRIKLLVRVCTLRSEPLPY